MEVLIGLLVFVLVSNCHGHDLYMNITHRTDKDYGPVIDISCQNDDDLVQFEWCVWKFNDRLLLRGKQLLGADPLRYIVQNNLKFTIRNALKEDEGLYICHCVTHSKDELEPVGSWQDFHNTTYVHVLSYLPPLDYPKCSIQPGFELVIGTNVTYACDLGESNPSPTMDVVAYWPDGSNADFKYLLEVLKTDFHHNSSMFSATLQVQNVLKGVTIFCFMDNGIFKTAPVRNCAVGPVSFISVMSSAPSVEIDARLTGTSLPSTTMRTEQMKSSDDFGNTRLSRAYPGDIPNAVVAPGCIIIATVIIAYFVWRNQKLKKIIASSHNRQLRGGDDSYIGLEKSTILPPHKYMDLNVKVEQSGSHSSSSNGRERKYENRICNSLTDEQNNSVALDERKLIRDGRANWAEDSAYSTDYEDVV